MKIRDYIKILLTLINNIMKNSSFLWQVSGSLQELANQLETAKNEQNWQKVARISQLLVKKAKDCEKKGEEFWENEN